MDVIQSAISQTEFEHFLDLPENRDRLFELIDGRIVEKIPTELHGAIVARLIAYLVMFADQHHLEHVTSEARHRAAQETLNDRISDIAFTSKAHCAYTIVDLGIPPH